MSLAILIIVAAGLLGWAVVALTGRVVAPIQVKLIDHGGHRPPRPPLPPTPFVP